MKKTAILVDGGFFIKRYRALCTDATKHYNPVCVANALEYMAIEHIKKSSTMDGEESCLYRIFYYDCMPFDGMAQNPISKTTVNFKKTPAYKFQHAFIDQLKKKRRLALRLGRMANTKQWVIKDQKQFKKMVAGTIVASDLKDTDLMYVAQQKQVDVKLGLDIATLAYKQLVDQIIIIAGDSDFVPVTKVARREGIDIVLDPMRNHVSEDLQEHIDGLRTTWSAKAQNAQAKRRTKKITSKR